MKSISYWAKLNPWKARVVLVMTKLLLFSLAVYSGIFLARNETTVNISLSYYAAIAIVMLFLFYPEKTHHKKIPYHYFKQKFCDFGIAACAFISITGMTNRLEMNAAAVSPIFASSVFKNPTAAEILASLEHRDKSTLTGKEKKILSKEFQKQLKIYAKALVTNNEPQQIEAWKIILVIVGILGLLFLLAGLTCSLSCNGSEGGAAILGILGLVAIIWGAVAVIKRMQRGPKTVPVPKE